MYVFVSTNYSHTVKIVAEFHCDWTTFVKCMWQKCVSSNPVTIKDFIFNSTKDFDCGFLGCDIVWSCRWV